MAMATQSPGHGAHEFGYLRINKLWVTLVAVASRKTAVDESGAPVTTKDAWDAAGDCDIPELNPNRKGACRATRDHGFQRRPRGPPGLALAGARARARSRHAVDQSRPGKISGAAG